MGTVIAILTLIVARYVGLIWHELAHLAAAYLVGWQPVSFSIGAGKPLWDFTRRGVAVKITLNPLGGCVRAFAKTPSYFKWKLFLFAIAGPVATSLLLLALYWALQNLNRPEHEVLELALYLAIFVQALSLFSCLWPAMVRMDGQLFRTDALTALHALLLSRDKAKSEYLKHGLSHAWWCVGKGDDPAAKILLNGGLGAGMGGAFYINLLLNAGRQADAEAEWERVEQLALSSTPVDFELLDSLACIPVFFGHQSMIPAALLSIEKAIQADPEAITLKGTKASLLTEKGELDEGSALIHEVLRVSKSENDLGICSYYAALITFKRGQRAEAIQEVKRAQKDFPGCMVGPRIRGMIVGLRGKVPVSGAIEG